MRFHLRKGEVLLEEAAGVGAPAVGAVAAAPVFQVKVVVGVTGPVVPLYARPAGH